MPLHTVRYGSGKSRTRCAEDSQTPQVNEQFKTTRHPVFQDRTGRPMVEAFIIKDMDHGTPIDPDSAPDQGGTSVHDKFIIPAGICSSFFIAKF